MWDLTAYFMSSDAEELAKIDATLEEALGERSGSGIFLPTGLRDVNWYFESAGAAEEAQTKAYGALRAAGFDIEEFDMEIREFEDDADI